MYRKCLKLGASAIAIMVAAQSAAHAQGAPAGAEQVVVTRSRVITNGNDGPTSATVISTDMITATAPATVFDGLVALPVFDGSLSPQSNPGNSSQNDAAHEFNLRNIGITRTMVLYDGRRIAPTAPTGQINADILPEYPLQRVDTVTGGVSAVYGSDAVSGVVNFVTDKNFNCSLNNLSLDILEKYHGRTRWNSDRTQIYSPDHLPSAAYTNATLTYNLGNMSYFLTVGNPFDKQPTPYGANGGYSGVPGLFGGFVPGDDAISRYYTVGPRMRPDRSIQPLDNGPAGESLRVHFFAMCAIPPADGADFSGAFAGQPQRLY